MRKWILVAIIFLSINIYGHQGEDHSEDDGWEDVSVEIPKEALKKINQEYIKTIKPIFQRKCLDCHGSGNKLPWYSEIPGPKQLIAHDIKEAKSHMDMTNDFPFLGHGTPEDDLKAVARTVKERSMPPLRYKVMHWNSTLNKEEKKKVSEWVTESLKLITPKKEEENDNH